MKNIYKDLGEDLHALWHLQKSKDDDVRILANIVDKLVDHVSNLEGKEDRV